MVEIRPARADHPQLRALLAALDDYLASLYPPEANHLLSDAELLAPTVTFLAAWQGERALGCGAVRRVSDTEADYGEVKRMYVDPGARGRRIGEQLLERLEASLTAAGVRLAMLETGRDQHAAVRLYERCGYRRRAAFGGYPDNGSSLFYEKRL
jgi:putative acetyltransferase